MTDLAVSVAAAALAEGRLAILVDDQLQMADLVLAASRVSARGIAFMATHGRGLTELALSPARVTELRLAPMVRHWDTPRKPFTVSIEARRGVGTGISAADRAETIRVAVAADSAAEDLISPGHVFPLRAGGLGTVGRAEAALALARLAGCGEGAVLCTILNETGDLADERYLTGLASRYDLPVVRASSITGYAGGAGLVPASMERSSPEARSWR